jgi:hypothetical protein
VSEANRTESLGDSGLAVARYRVVESYCAIAHRLAAEY